MLDIKEITKNTLEGLKNKRLAATPENYFLEFITQAKNSEESFKELEIFESSLYNLTKDEKNSLQKNSIFGMLKILSNRTSNDDLKKLIETFSDTLAPSINYDISYEIEDFIFYLLKNPKEALTKESLSQIKKFAKLRVEQDRLVLKDKTHDIIKLTSLMSRYYDKTLKDSTNQQEDIKRIKDDLVTLDISDSSKREILIVQKKLINSIEKMESSLLENNKILSTNIDKVKLLNRQIQDLEKELQMAKEEYLYDFLTNIYNRRAYDNEIKKMEKQYFLFNTNYAIIFFDIDHFKKINDKYGHSCGDEILKSFANIIKNLTRKEDVIARYGGEEFVALINFRDKVEISRYVKRVKNAFLNSTFVYKSSKINITFSAGVTFRNRYDSLEQAHEKADNLLYEAKRAGRNKVFFDDGNQL
ncbi:GGDEF domain-containing protein [Arcobacter porcinus]|uniref:GGDEF domain-containing protein n=1 Tax=Arcobacter porcinus TaxID=1935204 RepID=UPI00082555B8|nr:GGDEF domain-containing protein [Arcobacter porcinus]OCL87371.1 Response regulator PleD [Arcobacter porcinus]